ncbi:putative nucleotidyltransferase with HDIG domain [Rhodoferax ferrireducens]|uniref:Nucleotidyltransferase with HDIG domain n=1 Tax=Rhodoferax ferrireducens TaxID=192843 RepID=A0ABU2CEY0_9BURK|nr:HD-GYP domain-containing protein [Rhodoferax ferrireducens]MDR7379893.1 putative nucleotidyltransferase with HDIG domain [Rhodoferax ferrireducens]
MLKRISVQQLALGMHIDGFCAPWMDHPFWRNHFVLSDPKDIERVLASSVLEVWIDTTKGLDVPPGVEPLAQTTSAEAIAQEILQVEAPARDTTPTTAAVEYARASRICVKSKQAVMAMFDSARSGQPVNTELATLLVQEISDSVQRNPDAMISLARLKTADNYTYMHSVAVSALMVSLALQLQLDAEQTKIAGMGGLLHDLGKALTPSEVLNKPAKLTDAEFDVIKAHPANGYDMLVNDPSLDAMVLDIVLHHHEKTDGTGYPAGLKGEDISLFARMGAICDVYDAITSDRPYKKGWDPSEAMRKMAGWTSGHLDAQVFQAFVKSVGIYPTGSLVRLSSGRIGVVTAQNPRALLKPVVKVFFSTKSDMRIPPVLINLALPECKEKITNREDPQVWKFPDLNPLWSGFEPSSW